MRRKILSRGKKIITPVAVIGGGGLLLAIPAAAAGVPPVFIAVQAFAGASLCTVIWLVIRAFRQDQAQFASTFSWLREPGVEASLEDDARTWEKREDEEE